MSKTNWIKAVNDINRARYVIPEGWDTADKVAESLECSPDKVADILKPGIQSGDIERDTFPVWDENRRMTIRVLCYRISGADKKPSSVKPTRGASIEDRIRAAITRYPEKTNREIAKNLFGVTSADVAAVRAAASSH